MKHLLKKTLLVTACLLLVGASNAWATEVTPSLSGWTSNVGTGGSVATDESTPPVTTFTCGTTKGNAVSLTSTTSYTNISKIALDLCTSDRSKMDVKIEIGTLVESVFTPVDGGTFTSTYDSENKKLIIGTLSVGKNSLENYYSGYVSPDDKTGYVRITIANASSSSGKIGYVKNLKITYAAAPTITTQPSSAAYVTGYAATALHVAATASAGELSYQWYRCDDVNKSNSSAIGSATAASYTPSTENAGTFYYYCVVSDSNGSTGSSVATITVSAASAPTISVSGAPVGDIVTGTEVTLTADVTGNPTPTIQWYRSNDGTTGNYSIISGATELTYSPSTATPGTYYYFAQVVNTEGNALSAVQTIVVKDKVATPTFTPNNVHFGTASQSVEIACGTDGATIQYSTDNGDTWNDYTAAINVTETTTIKAKATKDGCINSDEASSTFTKITLTPQADVTSATTWDWDDVTNGEKVEFTDTELHNTDVTFANISKYGFTAVSGLASQDALLMNGQRAYNDANGSKHCQVGSLKFNTTVPGTVTVEYANTGNNAARTVKVNNTKGSQSSTANNSYVSETIAVTAGAVTIAGVQVSDDAASMLRIRKVIFTPVASVSVEVTDAGYATYVPSYDLDFSGTDIEAYKVKVNDPGVATMTKVNKVPAGTPVLLYYEGGKTEDIPTMAGADAVTGNDLVAGTGATVPTYETVSTENDYTNMILNKIDSKVGFYYAAGNTVAANRAYLHIATSLAPDPEGEGARGMILEFADDILTGINEAAAATEAAQKEGKFVVDGKLVIFKKGMKFNANGARIY